MTENFKKAGYTAPRMEATSFVTEHGYAGSGGGPKSTTQALGDLEFTFGG